MKNAIQNLGYIMIVLGCCLIQTFATLFTVVGLVFDFISKAIYTGCEWLMDISMKYMINYRPEKTSEEVVEETVEV